MYDRILVATDGSEGATAAVEHAISLAEAVDATLFGVAVRETRTGYDNAIVDPKRVERERRADAERWLEQLEAQASERGVDTTTTYRSGIPHEEIRREASERAVELIVLGATGRSALRGALLGSTVDRLVRTISHPVLVVE